MSKVGLIDIQSVESGRQGKGLLYVFSGRGNDYRLDETVELTGVASPPYATALDRCLLSLPLDLLNFRVLTFPFVDPEKLRSVIPFELEGLIIDGAESVVFDFRVLGESGGESEVLVVYAERKALGQLLAKYASLGFDAEIVTSVELQAALSRSGVDLSSHLMEPALLSAEERISRAKTELSANTINLRTGPFAYTKGIEKQKRMLRITALLALLLALVVNADLLFRAAAAKKEVSALRKEIRSTYTTLFPEDKKISDEVYQMKSHIKALHEHEDLVSGVSALRFLLALSQNIPQGVNVDELTIDRESAAIKGESASMSGVDEAKQKLSGFLDEVTVSDVKPSVEGKTRFTLLGRVPR